MLINVCILPLIYLFIFFSIFEQAVVNYDEIKNFIRQQVIKVFDGEDILTDTFLCKSLISLPSVACLVLKLDSVSLLADVESF